MVGGVKEWYPHKLEYQICTTKAYKKNRQHQAKSWALLMVGLQTPWKQHSWGWPHTGLMSKMQSGRCNQKLWDSKQSQGIMMGITLAVISWGCVTVWGSVIRRLDEITVWGGAFSSYVNNVASFPFPTAHQYHRHHLLQVSCQCWSQLFSCQTPLLVPKLLLTFTGFPLGSHCQSLLMIFNLCSSSLQCSFSGVIVSLCLWSYPFSRSTVMLPVFKHLTGWRIRCCSNSMVACKHINICASFANIALAKSACVPLPCKDGYCSRGFILMNACYTYLFWIVKYVLTFQSNVVHFHLMLIYNRSFSPCYC